MADSQGQKTCIKFYSTEETYGFLSNFSSNSVLVNGITWPTVEHWYQAQKFIGKEGFEAVLRADTPARAKKIGSNKNSPYGPLRKDWEEIKEDVMFAGLVAKFTQNRKLSERLLATGNVHLVEHAKKDSYWGDGGNGNGRNRLGALLERVRDELKAGVLKPSKKNVRFPPEKQENVELKEKEKEKEKEQAETEDAEEEEEEEVEEEEEEEVVVEGTQTQVNNYKNESSADGSNEDVFPENSNNNNNSTNTNTNNTNTNTNTNNDNVNSAAVISGSSANNGNDNVVDGDENEIEENTNHTQSAPGPRVISQKRIKTKARRGVWKDEAGRSLFEMDETTPGQVLLVGGEGISIPVSALPSNAKIVVKRNQFSRRNEATEAELENNDDDDNDDNDDVQQYIYRPKKKETLGDYLGTKNINNEKPSQSESAEFLMSPTKCLDAAQTNLELYHFLDASDPTKNQVKNNLYRIRDALISFISQSTSLDDNTMNQMLSQLTVLNDVVGQA